MTHELPYSKLAYEIGSYDPDELNFESASGNIASFDNGADDVPLKSLKVNIVPKQSGSGDPSPSNVRPITGWDEVEVVRCGINIVDKDSLTEDAGNFILNDNGVQTADAQSSYYLKRISVKPNTDYYFNGGAGVNGMQRLYYFDIDDNFISRTGAISSARAITTPSNCAYIRIQFKRDSLNKDTWGINYPSTDTTYHSYQGTSYPISLPSTVYGGELDVTSGVLTIDRAKIVLNGTQNIAITNWRPQTNSVGWIYDGNVADFKVESNWEAIPSKLVSNKLKTESYYHLFENDTIGVGIYTSNTYSFAIKLNDMSLTTASAINSYLSSNPIEVVYELATPTTVQLTPTEVKSLLGNNIWSDAGSVEVEYIPAVEKNTFPYSGEKYYVGIFEDTEPVAMVRPISTDEPISITPIDKPIDIRPIDITPIDEPIEDIEEEEIDTEESETDGECKSEFDN